MPSVITSFSGQYRFLSNFYRYPITHEGYIWGTVEHAYQAAKTTNKEDIEKIRLSKTPGEAKHLGSLVVLRPDWNKLRLVIMYGLLKKKFWPGGVPLEWLLATGDARLVEGNWWGDRFWGVCNGVGENHLGKLLMQIREELPDRA